ncbi:LytTR family transcriptional regulator [Tamlana nanhaiensis]|uniref:LytTR family transcriptional regulator n=1 Tax=Neotamlana nanhaiensis TaxID=1382798 RepID=A0A0D7W9N0_9FLAO|nr:LytTR family DNA-binding domain-containing protein [Tamlana nanhaiensis]KJD34462.1 LytTR family transcriptional regulator [Tamlana nanhaiensis]
MIKAIAIDDEPLALQIIDVYCNSSSVVRLEKTFSDLTNAKKYLNKFPIDVIFLDIEMPKTNGIEFYKSLNREIKVIFTTAYDHYAVEGFNVNAVDYLLKPFSLERFNEAIDRVQKLKASEHNNPEENTHLSIRANYKLNRIPLETILYIEAMDDYVKIHIKDEKTIVARSTMKGILENLPENQFIRIHKSYIIPSKNIKHISTSEISLGYISLPLGNSYKKMLENLL